MRTEDGSIIHQCLNGKTGAFGMLVDKYKEGVYAYVYTELRNLHDAQDVTQEVFLQAYRDLRSLRKWESFAFWLHRIAYRRCMDWLRVRSRRADQELIEDQYPKTVNASSLDSYRRNQLSESVQEALDSLPEIYREVLMLHYFGGMTIRDIASAIGASPSAIGKRLSRGRAQLKEEMIAMMDTAFEGQRLPAGFTFHIVEAVKRIKINPMPRIAGVPLGLSLAMGIIITVLSINPHLSILSNTAIPNGFSLPVEARILDRGKVPVDIMRTSETSVISTREFDGNELGNIVPDLQNALFMAPQAEGGTWTKKTDIPTARNGLSSCAVNGKIYAIGGWLGNTPMPIVEEYDPVKDKWTRKADTPTARGMLSTSAVNGKIYAIGGYDFGFSFATVEEYDPISNSWIKKSNMPMARSHFSSSVIGDKIYVIGGMLANFGQLNEVLTTIEYDPVKDTWTKKSDIPIGGITFADVIHDKIYVVIMNMMISNSLMLEEYNPVTDTWVRKADMPVGRRWPSICALNGKLYAIGGCDDNNIGLSTVEEYDPVSDTWTKKTDMQTGRFWLSTCAMSGRIYAIGGNHDEIPLSTVEQYNPGTGESINLKGKLPTTWGEVKTALRE